jgi:2-oxoglutarate ferredoxin oxidoreductase subunit beta
MMRVYKENSLIKNGADTREAGLSFEGKIICGKFVDRERPSYLEMYNAKMAARFGPSFKPYEGVS